MLSDTLPVFDTGAAQRVNAEGQSGFLDRRHIDDIRQPFNKRLHQILFFNVAGGQRRIKRNTLDALQTGSEQFIGAIFDNLGHVGIRRAAVWRIVPIPPSSGGLWDGVITIPSASGPPFCYAPESHWKSPASG